MDTEPKAIPEIFTDDAGANFMRRAMAAGYDIYYASDACVVEVVSAPFERPPFRDDPWLEEFFKAHRKALTVYLRRQDDRTGLHRGTSAQPSRRS